MNFDSDKFIVDYIRDVETLEFELLSQDPTKIIKFNFLILESKVNSNPRCSFQNTTSRCNSINLVPDEVGFFSAVLSNSSEEILLEWSKPLTNKGKIINYTVEIFMDGEQLDNWTQIFFGNWTQKVVLDGSTTMLRFTVPKYCRTYHAIIYANTSAGAGNLTTISIRADPCLSTTVYFLHSFPKYLDKH